MGRSDLHKRGAVRERLKRLDRRKWLCVGAVSAAMILTGCGGDDSGSDSASDEGSSSAASAEVTGATPGERAINGIKALGLSPDTTITVFSEDLSILAAEIDAGEVRDRVRHQAEDREGAVPRVRRQGVQRRHHEGRQLRRHPDGDQPHGRPRCGRVPRGSHAVRREVRPRPRRRDRAAQPGLAEVQRQVRRAPDRRRRLHVLLPQGPARGSQGAGGVQEGVRPGPRRTDDLRRVQRRPEVLHPAGREALRRGRVAREGRCLLVVLAAAVERRRHVLHRRHERGDQQRRGREGARGHEGDERLHAARRAQLRLCRDARGDVQRHGVLEHHVAGGRQGGQRQVDIQDGRQVGLRHGAGLQHAASRWPRRATT